MRRNYLYKPKLKIFSQTLRKEMTAAERKLWYDFLRQHQFRFLRQKPIDNYIVDFYCPKLRLIIEVDGKTHLEENEKKDQIRTKNLEKLGLNIIRFWNNDVLKGFDIVCEEIDDKIKALNPPSPL